MDRHEQRDRFVPQDLVSGIGRCDETSNRAVRDYLGFAHPAPESARSLLTGWQRRVTTSRRTSGRP